MEAWARDLARAALARELPRRWRHVQAVAAKARRVRPAVEPDGGLLVAAAYLHDIGYAPDIVDTGFHQLDGARFLRARGAPDRLTGLVANHSLASADAEQQGWAGGLAEFPDEHTPVRDALWFCDMTTGPDGQTMTVAERVAEVARRYGPDHPKTKVRVATAPERGAIVYRVRTWLRAAGIPDDATGQGDRPAEPRVGLPRRVFHDLPIDPAWLRRIERPITDDLVAAFGWLPARHVRAVVCDAAEELGATAVVPDFLPLLIQRRAYRNLSRYAAAGRA